MAEREIVVVHSSDVHIDVPYPARPAFDPLHALRRVIRTAESLQADLLLLVGDIFDHNRQPETVVEGATELFASTQMQIVILPGNHDPLTPDSVYRRGTIVDAEHVHVLGLT